MRKWVFYSYDIFVAAVAPLAALIIRENFTIDWQKVELLLPYLAMVTAVSAVSFLVAGTHRGIWRYATLPDFTRILATVSVSILITLALYFILVRGEGIPRSVPPIQWAVAVAMMAGARLLARSFFRHPTNSKPRLITQKEHTLVVGLNHVAELYLRCVADLGRGRIVVEGILEEEPGVKGRLLYHHKVIGQPVELPRLLDDLRVHGIEVARIVVAMPFEELSGESRKALLHWEAGGDVVLDLFEERLGFNEMINGSQETNEEKAGTRKAEHRIPENLDTVAKRLIDITGSLALMIALSPFMVLTALLVLVDLGSPVLFRQQRLGRYGHSFTLYKFRTMGSAHDCNGRRIPDEKRHSSIGAFLRHTRLDELPQLFNILIGDMSFVGPRPLLPVDHPENGEIRLAVRPGITGWAQINGGKLVTPEEKLALDIWYLKRMSIRGDLIIAIKTLRVAITGDNLDRSAIQAAMDDVVAARNSLEQLHKSEGEKKLNQKSKNKFAPA